jgi:hypothetical protein
VRGGVLPTSLLFSPGTHDWNGGTGTPGGAVEEAQMGDGRQWEIWMGEGEGLERSSGGRGQQ